MYTTQRKPLLKGLNGERRIHQAFRRLGLEEPEILTLRIGAQGLFEIPEGALVVLTREVDASNVFRDLRRAASDVHSAIHCRFGFVEIRTEQKHMAESSVRGGVQG